MHASPPYRDGSGKWPAPSESVSESDSDALRDWALACPQRDREIGQGPSRRDSDGSSGRGTDGTAAYRLGRDTGGPRLRILPAAATQPAAPARNRPRRAGTAPLPVRTKEHA